MSSNQENRSQILRAATIVMFAFILSRVIGVIRDMVINYYYGIHSIEATAYITASRFPEIIFYVIAGGALGSAFIPTFSAYFTRDDAAGGWRLFSTIINLVLLVTTAVCLITSFFAPHIVAWFLSDLSESSPLLQPLTISMLRVMLLSPIIFSMSGVIMGALNARQHFLLPAIAPIAYNLGIILGATLFAPNVMGLAWGTVIGAVAHLMIQLPGLYQQKATYHLTLSLSDPGVKQVGYLMLPRLLGLSVGQLNHVITQYLAQFMILGSIPALGSAWRIMLMPQAILGQAMGIAAFPTFATMAAQSAYVEMRRILADTVRFILFIGVPATLFLIILRYPIITILFQRGEFDAQATEFVASALLFYAWGLVALALLEVISRAFYALEDTYTPLWAGLIQLASMSLLGFWLSQVVFPHYNLLPLGGLALAVSLSNIIEIFVLLELLRRKMKGINGRYIWDGFWRILFSGAALSISSYLTYQQLLTHSLLIQLIVPGLTGGISYLLIAYLLQLPELTQLYQQLQKKLVRK